VISDHHRGLMNAIDATMIGATWQRCRVHFMRNVLGKVSKGNTDMVDAAIRTIFAQPTGPLVREQVETIASMLEATLPAVAAMLRAAREEITAFADFPELHWRKIWSTNPIERLNREVKRRTDVVGIFPNAAALHRLSACVLIEAHDEWQVSDRRYLSEASMALLTPPAPTALQPRPAEIAVPACTHRCWWSPALSSMASSESAGCRSSSAVRRRRGGGPPPGAAPLRPAGVCCAARDSSAPRAGER